MIILPHSLYTKLNDCPFTQQVLNAYINKKFMKFVCSNQFNLKNNKPTKPLKNNTLTLIIKTLRSKNS